ncbi:MAG: PQQ-dependent dehydrogenase, methanol/ethanol family [Acidobacteriota bacterium]
MRISATFRAVLAAAMAAGAAWVVAAQQPGRTAAKAGKVTQAKLNNAAKDGTEWLTYGRDYAETHFSPLKQISDKNVNRLGLAFAYDPQMSGAFESTPLVSNGILYGTGAWSVVFAIDAKTGAYKWRFDPEVTRGFISHLCCGPETRGLALYNGKVYVTPLDGRLIALDQETGKKLWSVETTPKDSYYSITSPPRVVKGHVIVGNAGAEFGVRGYFGAYDAETGKQEWRFYTVPGDPSKPFEHPELAAAAKTWNGAWWEHGGGGTVWDAMAYDPEANLLYVGTGNGAPWNRDVRSPGGGDNLYLASILAVNPDTGRMKWYYQTTPGDTWDFNSTQSLILADLPMGGVTRKVIMQAPKNGFYFVIDRISGEFISAEMYTAVNWAKGFDKKGRPIETANARYKNEPIRLWAGGGGAHNWPPMAFSPLTNLAYLPGQNRPFSFAQDPNFRWQEGKQNFAATFPPLPNQPVAPGPANFLVAWDPIAQKERWRIAYPGGGFNGGAMATAGNLVFHGVAVNGMFYAYDATSGSKLWEIKLSPGMATPVTYEMDGVQYVAVIAGRGEQGRLYTFALDGKAPMPALPSAPGAKGGKAVAAKGKQ